jgi:Fibronectin type III domain
MSEITGATYAYTFDQVVFVRVSSTSEYGTSDPQTNIDGARARTVPEQVTNLVITTYSDTAITITWNALSGTTAGNSAITAYAIYWNDGVTLDDADKFVTEALLSPTTYTFTNIGGGKTYKFAVKAKNIYGYGTLSSTVQTVAVDVPAKMDIPTVALSTVSPFTSVVITWAVPNFHYSPIEDYDVRF